jgi:hypothetical protein
MEKKYYVRKTLICYLSAEQLSFHMMILYFSGNDVTVEREKKRKAIILLSPAKACSSIHEFS